MSTSHAPAFLSLALSALEPRRTARASALSVLAAAWLLLGLLLAARPLPAAPLHVGHLTLQPCHTGAPWCGTLARPLDPSGRIAGTLSVYFEYWPHASPGAAVGTLVATEGGPGYPATESRAAYLALFGPLMATHDVLIMDNRGTGRSGAIDCEPLQTAPALTEEAIGACGRSLGSRAPFYSTTLAADDLAAVLDALALTAIDLYGDSYGTYFSQVFAVRHPGRLRSLVLDGAYPLDGPDYPWYPHYAPAMRAKFNLACERDPRCRTLPGTSVERIAAALARLRAQPFKAQVHGSNRLVPVTADAAALATVMFSGSPAYTAIRDLDAAARAFGDGDRTPLLRLIAETAASVDSRDPGQTAAGFSAGLAAAVSCQDAPQIFDMALAPGPRTAARDLALERRKTLVPDAYAPFTLDEYRAMPPDYAFIDQCVRWPAPPDGAPALPLVGSPGPYPDVPVLVISGELDNMTSVADGQAAADHFPRAQHVVIANSFHVNALPHARSGCAARLVRRFLADLEVGDQSCAAQVPPVALVPRFARSLSELAPLHALPGNQAQPGPLRAAAAAVLACEDVLVRSRLDDTGYGLRGGTFTARPARGGQRITLQAVRWTADLSVSGWIEDRGRDTALRAHLTLSGPPTASGTLDLTWDSGTEDAHAAARGVLGGHRVLADSPAP